MVNYYDEYIKYKKIYDKLKKSQFIDCKKLYIKKIDSNVRINKKKKVYDYLLKNVIKNANFKSLKPTQLKETYLILDKVYFEGEINKYLQKNCDIELDFKTSGRLKTTAGKCNWRYDFRDDDIKFRYKIEISSPIIYSLFDKGEKSLKINGLNCTNKLECYINLFEHELTHLVIFLFCPELGKGMGGHTQVFRAIVKNLFGHTEYKHYLLYGNIEQVEKDAEEAKINVEIDDHIITKPIGGKILSGIVKKVNPKSVRILLDSGKLFNIYYFAIAKIDKKNKKMLVSFSTKN
jgi:hypothetical protein